MTRTEAPERIWAKARFIDGWADPIAGSFHRPDYVEFVRADKLEELAAENERLKETAAFHENNWKHERDLKLTVVSALAEKDKEIAALREALEEIENGCDGRVDPDSLPCRIARAALAQGADDERA